MDRPGSVTGGCKTRAVIGPVAPGAPFDAFAEAFAPGLVGTITVAIYDTDDNILFGPTAADITEIAAIGTLARYATTLYAPESADSYLVVWNDNDPDDPNSASEELVVSRETTIATGVAWVDGEQVAACCGVDYGSATQQALDEAAAAANEILFQLSGRQFPGVVGPVKVRPYGNRCWWADTLPQVTPPVWTSGYGWFARWGVGPGYSAGSPQVSYVRLDGGLIREIIAVKVDGAFLTSPQYRLDEGNLLVRAANPTTGRRQWWPSRQRMDLPDTEDGTWSITYTWGQDPPQPAVDAAVELGCEIYKACVGDDDCALPSGVTRVVRQGVTVERAILADAIAKGKLNLPMVDLFLGTYNPRQVTRQSAVFSPDLQPHPWRPGS